MKENNPHKKENTVPNVFLQKTLKADSAFFPAEPASIRYFGCHPFGITPFNFTKHLLFHFSYDIISLSWRLFILDPLFSFMESSLFLAEMAGFP